MVNKRVRVELYVVTTNNPDKAKLEEIKAKLCDVFGGLTVIPNCEGYWMDGTKMVTDETQIWVILSSTVITTKDILPFAEQLKLICQQKSQLFTVNGTPYFI